MSTLADPVVVEVTNPETPFAGVQATDLDTIFAAVEVLTAETPFAGVQVFGATETPIQITLREGVQGPQGPPGPPGPAGPAGEDGAGTSGATEVWSGPDAPVPQDEYLVWIDTDAPDPIGGGGGGGGGDLNFVFNQLSPSSSWLVTHNLGKFPSVSVVDSGATLIIPNVIYTDINHVTISFGSATSGKAYLN
jgi:hypothetical protein